MEGDEEEQTAEPHLAQAEPHAAPVKSKRPKGAAAALPLTEQQRFWRDMRGQTADPVKNVSLPVEGTRGVRGPDARRAEGRNRLAASMRRADEDALALKQGRRDQLKKPKTKPNSKTKSNELAARRQYTQSAPRQRTTNVGNNLTGRPPARSDDGAATKAASRDRVDQSTSTWGRRI